MKKRWLYLMILLIVLLCAPALADDLAGECKIYQAEKGRLDSLTDHDDATGVQLREAVEHVLEIRPGATPVASLSLVMGRDMLPFTVQTQGACQSCASAGSACPSANRYTSRSDRGAGFSPANTRRKGRLCGGKDT